MKHGNTRKLYDTITNHTRPGLLDTDISVGNAVKSTMDLTVHSGHLNTIMSKLAFKDTVDADDLDTVLQDIEDDVKKIKLALNL